ncbi:hypothetical protein BV25DRAFT_1986811 [Artomyces pyxidatus]|uniref:Uncharacterized protein n=1 Tax=Artomyces pyxidatus TaxID=48021 RepID=A0ACB8TLI6_9AGAM|nr:hypothetical protein BV25DRAFT_1986811 [Artomyces pyxidatus]
MPIASASEFWSTVTRDRLAALRGAAFNARAIASKRRLLDAEVSAVELSLCALKAEINHLSPVSHLPPEIISRILLFHAANDHPDINGPDEQSSHDRRPCNDPGWVKATYVCRRWRQIALDCPGLWNHVILACGATLATTMTAHAKAAPLVVTLNLDWASDRRVMRDFVAAHMHRTKRLTVFSTRDRFYEDSLSVNAHLNRPAPLLESADLVWDCPDDIFDHHAPRLRYFTLRYCQSVPWTSPCLLQLVSLKVYGEVSTHHPVPSSSGPLRFAELTAVLQAMSALEVLVLHNTFPFDFPDEAGPTPKLIIAPPLLRVFELSDRCKHVTRLLWHMHIPPTASVALHCYSRDAVEDNLIPSVLTALEQTGFFASLVGPQLTHVHYYVSWRMFDLRAWKPADYMDPDTTHNKEDATGGLTFSAEYSRPVELYADALLLAKAIHQCIPAVYLRHLCVDINSQSFVPQTWHDMLGDACELRSMRVAQGSAPASLLSALEPSVSGRLGDMLFPRLSSLEIVYSDSEAFDRQSFGKKLVTVLKSRKKRGAAIRELRISVFAEKKHVKQLRKLVPQFEVLDQSC